LTRLIRTVALMAVASVLLMSCAKLGSSAGSNVQPADIYAAGPSVADVRALFADNNWWPGPPSFGVRPLDSASVPDTERFAITQRFLHLGSAEVLEIRYTVYDKTGSATSRMTSLQNAYGASPTSPKVGDQVLYYGLFSGGGAPYITRTFVRLGQVIVELLWARKDGIPTVTQLGKNAAKVVDGLKKVTTGKVHGSPRAVDQTQLPPPGLDITFLGSAQLPVEAWLVMADVGIPEPVLKLLHNDGVTDFVFGDYALNTDTHMEVRTALLTFSTSTAATDWVSTFSNSAPDQSGIAGSYIDSLGVYHYLFASGTHGAMLVCSSTAASEAASRACESPLVRTSIAWKLGLGG
jgi:hypothetical protein